MPKAMPPSEMPVYQMKVTLKGSKPPIWRRIQVGSWITLENLHCILQEVMGWENAHLHQFEMGKKTYGEPNPEYEDLGLEVIDEATVRLGEVVKKSKDRFLYEYDFGDSWYHEVRVEKVLPREQQKKYPVCLAGKRACPPEDCGGLWGYYDLLEAIQNADHPDHEQVLEWVGGEYDPEEFDIDEVNRRLKSLSES